MGKCIPLLALAAMMTATLAMPSAQAETATKLGAIAQDHVFFTSGGPANGKGNPPPPQASTAAPEQPAPLPDGSLFTQVPNLGEQHREHALNLFGSRAAKPASGTATPAPAAVLPDANLFTQVPNLGEQHREHAFSLFGGPRTQGTAPAANTAVNSAATPAGQAPAPAAPQGPDKSLFTEVPNLGEQNIERPFSLF